MEHTYDRARTMLHQADEYLKTGEATKKDFLHNAMLDEWNSLTCSERRQVLGAMESREAELNKNPELRPLAKLTSGDVSMSATYDPDARQISEIEFSYPYKKSLTPNSFSSKDQSIALGNIYRFARNAILNGDFGHPERLTLKRPFASCNE